MSDKEINELLDKLSPEDVRRFARIGLMTSIALIKQACKALKSVASK